MEDAMDALGGKRKYKENPLTAKAETGSLKIKISRKGEGAAAANNGMSFLARLQGETGAFSSSGLSAPLSPSAQPAQPIASPPKPRPNRKHVPIFYQRPNAFDISATSSTDESAVQSTSVTSEYDATANVSTTSTSSTTGRFARMDIAVAAGLPGSYADPMPLTNPLFTRGMSETSGSLTDLLKTVLPPVHSIHTNSPYDYNNSGSTASLSEHMSGSQSSLLNPAAALRQLASSSPAYARMEPLEVHHNLQQFHQQHEIHPQQQHHRQQQQQQQQQTEQRRDDTYTHQQQQQQQPRQPSYHFDAMSALQNAVKMAVATGSPTTSHAPSYSHNDDSNDLGPPPSAPPAFTIQNSLMGGGIEAQPVIANVNTVNFDWNRYYKEGGTRPRSGSLPNVLEENSRKSTSTPNGKHQTQPATAPQAKEI